MWALLDSNNIVVDVIVGVSYEDALSNTDNGLRLVEMTLENSPGYMGGFYDGKKFNKPINYPEV